MKRKIVVRLTAVIIAQHKNSLEMLTKFKFTTSILAVYKFHFIFIISQLWSTSHPRSAVRVSSSSTYKLLKQFSWNALFGNN